MRKLADPKIEVADEKNELADHIRTLSRESSTLDPEVFEIVGNTGKDPVSLPVELSSALTGKDGEVITLLSVELLSGIKGKAVITKVGLISFFLSTGSGVVEYLSGIGLEKTR